MRTSLYFLLMLLFPAYALAGTAGFPTSSLWLSNDAPQAAEEVRVFSVLYNGESENVSGTLEFLIDGSVLDVAQVSLEPGTSRILSTHWVAETGSHTFSARFSGGETTEAQTSAAVTVSVATPPSPTQQAVSAAQETAMRVVASSTPIVKQAAQAVFATTENLRESGIEYLESVVEKSTPAVAPTSVQSGLSTVTETPEKDASSFVKNASQLAAAGALYAFETVWLFYILLLVLLYLLVRFVVRWVNKPRF